VFFPGCSFPGVLSRVFRPGCSFPDVLSIAQRVFFPEIAIHSLARESHPQSLRAPVCSYAPSVARQLRPLWHVICALCGTLSVPSVARHKCPLWQISCALVARQLCPLARQLCPLWHVICARCGTSAVPSVARHLCPRWCSPRSTTKQHVVQLLFGFTASVVILPTTCYWRGYVVVGLVTGTSTAIRADTGDLPFLGVLMFIVSLCYLVSHFPPSGGLYYHPFSNEGCSSLRVETLITLRFTIGSLSGV
jgi:hypothetical protein